jgi:hypothetical protein
VTKTYCKDTASTTCPAAYVDIPHVRVRNRVATEIVAESAVHEGWVAGKGNVRRTAHGWRRDVRRVRCSWLLPVRQPVRGGAEVHLVGCLPQEGGRGHLGVVLLNLERDQGVQMLDRVQRVEVQPLMPQRAPECLNHRVREGDIDLGYSIVELVTVIGVSLWFEI